MNKILTIIIPTYNMENYLHKCLDSLIVSEENMPQLEVLVVNDGSKDSSSQIAHEYESRYPQTFKVIDKENGNYGSCINRGLKEATGKYVKVLDADDSFATESLDKYLSYLKDKDCDMVLTDYYTVNAKGKVIKTHTYNIPTDRTFGLRELSQEIIYDLSHQDITYKTLLLKNMNYVQTEGISYTDNEWVFKPMMYVNRIMYCKQYLYLYLRGREGQTFDPKILMKNYNQRMVVMRSMLKYYVDTYNKYDEDTYRVMFVRLKKRLSGLYFCYLIRDRTTDGNDQLKAFDNELKNISFSLYEALNDVRLGWYYVKIWRKHGYNRNIFPLGLLRIAVRIVKGI